MAFRIFVGNLSYDVVDDDLREAFSAYGEVIFSRVILDRETGKSRGFGFIELKEESAGQKALDGLDGTQLKDRELRLKQAEPRDESDRPRPGGGGSTAARPHRPRSGDREGHRDFTGGPTSEDGTRRRSPPKKSKARDDKDKFRAPIAQQGRPQEKIRGGSKNRLQGYGDDDDDEEATLANYEDDEYDLSTVEGVEIEGVEIEGVEIEGVDLSGVSASEATEDPEDSSSAGLAQQLKRSLEKREDENT